MWTNFDSIFATENHLNTGVLNYKPLIVIIAPEKLYSELFLNVRNYSYM